MKEKFAADKISRRFDVNEFMSDQQDLIANILRERSVDLMKNVEESRKRDEERDRRRRAAEEARRF